MPSINWGSVQFITTPEEGNPSITLRFRHDDDLHSLTLNPEWRADTSQQDYEDFCLGLIGALEDIGYSFQGMSRLYTAVQPVSYIPGP